MNYQKYNKGYKKFTLQNRTWPNNEITSAPYWSSTDLRDGNQALIKPLNIDEKLEFFNLLVDIGFKEIEIGFPAASSTEYQFVRTLIENNLIPDDVSIQVLTSAKRNIIEKTVKSLKGAKNVVIHMFSAMSELQRRVVFRKSREEMKKVAVDGAMWINEFSKKLINNGSNIRVQYSADSFTGTEMDYAVEVFDALVDAWNPVFTPKWSSNDKSARAGIILNLPSTMELSGPHIYADQVEYVRRNLKDRNLVELCIHPHNDRGQGVAAAELGMLAGAERVEGTLFGNGERAGNLDILVVALNLFSHGIDPKLKLDDLDNLVQAYERLTKIKVHPRHPYAGEFIYTAFSGVHQDAIKKGLDAYYKEKPKYWENPYLPVDPTDLGREFAPVRINSQSGKSGVGFILEYQFGYKLPKSMLQELSYITTEISAKENKELMPEIVYSEFMQQYVNLATIFELKNYDAAIDTISATLYKNGEKHEVSSSGSSALDAMHNIFAEKFGIIFSIIDYNVHEFMKKSESKIAAYVAIKDKEENISWGAGTSDNNTTTASIKALVSAVNRLVLRL